MCVTQGEWVNTPHKEICCFPVLAPTNAGPRSLCSVLPLCVAVWCSLLQCVAVRGNGSSLCRVLPLFVTVCCSVLQYVAVWCSVLQCDAACCSVLQCVAVTLHGSSFYSVFPLCVAVCCSVLQCVAVCCSVLQWEDVIRRGPALYSFLFCNHRIRVLYSRTNTRFRVFLEEMIKDA